MQYRKDKQGNELSILGYGCMRFTQRNGKIDLDKAEKEVMEAFFLGVNYYDTAYIYPGSEAALGEILHRNQIRSQVKIATKLPHYMLRKSEDMNRFFEEELKRLQTDYVDYYLMHMLTDTDTWNRLCGMGIVEWLEEKRRSGQIRQVGFSYHGNSDMFLKLMDVYDWDFCQIQYNYLDENTQAGRTGLEYAAKKKVPVVIMEPLRGGKLVHLPKEAEELMKAYPIQRSPAEWAFRWLWNQPQVTCVLSGMNSLEMVRENAKAASETYIGKMTKEEQELLGKVVKAINGKVKVGCTGCRYCMPCPKNVDIPGTFAAYNRQACDGKLKALIEYFMCTGVRKNYTGPGNCVECGLCEKHCPQHIQIRKELKNAKKSLEGPIYGMAKKILPFFMKY